MARLKDRWNEIPVPEGPDEWKERAACRGADPRIFLYPEHRANLTQARKYCDVCPVKNECLEASQLDDTNAGTAPGVWAGMGYTDRRARFRAKRKAERGGQEHPMEARLRPHRHVNRPRKKDGVSLP